MNHAHHKFYENFTAVYEISQYIHKQRRILYILRLSGYIPHIRSGPQIIFL